MHLSVIDQPFSCLRATCRRSRRNPGNWHRTQGRSWAKMGPENGATI